MVFSLSTNWRCGAQDTADEVVDAALGLGFGELEIGFGATPENAARFLERRDEIPAGTVHAFAPVPLSAPRASPELYSLASDDENERAMAGFLLSKNIDFAAEAGADVLVHHAGRVGFSSFWHGRDDSVRLRSLLVECGKDVSAKPYAKAVSRAIKTRRERGGAALDRFCRELDALLPRLGKAGVALALENLPFLEGFPDEIETRKILEKFAGAPVKAWFDTGHHRVREMHGWIDAEAKAAFDELEKSGAFAGMHLNDVEDLFDDHDEPGAGKVDFAALAPMMRKAGHVVFEPKGHVTEERLAAGVAHIRAILADR